MSLRNAFFSTGFCLILAACGFQPLHGGFPPQVHGDNAALSGVDSARAGYSDFAIANIPDRDGQYLRNALIDRLHARGTPANPRYTLMIKPLRINVTNIGIRRDATSTRGQMQIDADVSIVERATGKTVLTRDLRSVGAYNQLDNQFATTVSKEYLTDRTLDEIADNIVTEINLFLARPATNETAAP